MPQPRLRPWLLALGICVAVVLICVQWVDRPVADWSAAHFGGTAAIALGRGFLRLSEPVFVAVVAFVIACGAWRLSGGPLPSWTQLPLRCGISMTVAFLVMAALKVAFGRSPASPLYLVDGVYVFRPFHGGTTFGALPSGTMSVGTAALAVLWIQSVRLRLLSVLGWVLLAASLIVTNSHWVGDIVAGSFLGAASGSLPMRLPRFDGAPASGKR